MMLTKIQKWGNSQGLRFSKTILEEAGIRIGDEVRIRVQDGNIVIEPTRRTHGKYTLESLIAEMPPEYKTEEVDWGSPEGNEVW
jgi:antitoxin MazE